MLPYLFDLERNPNGRGTRYASISILNDAIEEISDESIRTIIGSRLKDWMVKRHKS